MKRKINFIKEDAKIQGSSDGFWYDIANGYIKPEEVLIPEQLETLEDALILLQGFEQSLNEAGLIEEFKYQGNLEFFVFNGDEIFFYFTRFIPSLSMGGNSSQLISPESAYSKFIWPFFIKSFNL